MTGQEEVCPAPARRDGRRRARKLQAPLCRQKKRRPYGRRSISALFSDFRELIQTSEIKMQFGVSIDIGLPFITMVRFL